MQGRVWSIALAVDPATAEARASSRTDHTAELGGALGTISSFGVDAEGELYIVCYGNGTVVKVLGLSAPPAAPTGLRIIR